ncbi:MAG: DNA-binding protein [Gemmatimonadetes bacterium]|nr:DNA-binding protein [Gemmatimonadota bacterium]
MQYRKTPFGYLLVLDRGDELIRGLIAFARREDVDAAALYGIGAVSSVELAFFRLHLNRYERRTFSEELEACSIVGNLALLDDEPLPHVHGVFGRPDFSTIGGHIFEAVVGITLEISVHTVPTAVVRRPVDYCDLKLMRLEEPR